jgi:hypothetical protein
MIKGKEQEGVLWCFYGSHMRLLSSVTFECVYCTKGRLLPVLNAMHRKRRYNASRSQESR